jgi:flagellar motor switch protein FliG
MLLAGELPQTSALVLAHLRADHASRILTGLDEGTRTEVAHAIATMGSPSPAAVLAVAMKGAAEPVTEIITTNLSERNREILEDEVRILGPVRVSQVEDARAEIVRAIRDLEATGAITVQRGDEDAYVE